VKGVSERAGVAEIDAWEQTVKGVLERAWVAKMHAWESMIR
jgi:hypothetical protein